MSEYPADLNHPRTKAAIAHLLTIDYSEAYRGIVVDNSELPVAFCASGGLRTDVTRSAQKAADSTGRIQIIRYEEPVSILWSVPGEPESHQETYFTFTLPDYDRRRAICALAVTGHMPSDKASAIVVNDIETFDIDQMIIDTYKRLYTDTPHGFETRQP